MTDPVPDQPEGERANWRADLPQAEVWAAGYSANPIKERRREVKALLERIIELQRTEDDLTAERDRLREERDELIRMGARDERWWAEWRVFVNNADIAVAQRERLSTGLRAMARRATGLRRNAVRAVEREMDVELVPGETLGKLRAAVTLAQIERHGAFEERNRARAELALALGENERMCTELDEARAEELEFHAGLRKALAGVLRLDVDDPPPSPGQLITAARLAMLSCNVAGDCPSALAPEAAAARPAHWECTCEGPPHGTGPEADCDVHGQPSVAYMQGYANGERHARQMQQWDTAVAHAEATPERHRLVRRGCLCEPFPHGSGSEEGCPLHGQCESTEGEFRCTKRPDGHWFHDDGRGNSWYVKEQAAPSAHTFTRRTMGHTSVRTVCTCGVADTCRDEREAGLFEDAHRWRVGATATEPTPERIEAAARILCHETSHVNWTYIPDEGREGYRSVVRKVAAALTEGTET